MFRILIIKIVPIQILLFLVPKGHGVVGYLQVPTMPQVVSILVFLLVTMKSDQKIWLSKYGNEQNNKLQIKNQILSHS